MASLDERPSLEGEQGGRGERSGSEISLLHHSNLKSARNAIDNIRQACNGGGKQVAARAATIGGVNRHTDSRSAVRHGRDRSEERRGCSGDSNEDRHHFFTTDPLRTFTTFGFAS